MQLDSDDCFAHIKPYVCTCGHEIDAHQYSVATQAIISRSKSDDKATNIGGYGVRVLSLRTEGLY